MLVKDWMVSELITVTPDITLLHATKIMKENKIRRLPVVDDQGHLKGIVTDRDLKEAGPSKVTTLDVHEHFYLYGELTVKDIMTKDPICVTPEDTVESAALIMLSRKISGLPVVDGGAPVGIITQDDIARVLTEITGVSKGGVQLALHLPDAEEPLREVVEMIRAKGCNVVSVLCIGNGRPGAGRNTYIRVDQEDLTLLGPVIELVKDRGYLRYVVQDKQDKAQDPAP